MLEVKEGAVEGEAHPEPVETTRGDRLLELARVITQREVELERMKREFHRLVGESRRRVPPRGKRVKERVLELFAGPDCPTAGRAGRPRLARRRRVG